METRVLWLCLFTLALAAPGRGGSAEAASPLIMITLKDGGRLVGTIVGEDDTAVTLRTTSGLELKLLREAIAGTAPATEPDRSPDKRLSDPNDTRLLFAPTGRPLGKGSGYFSNHYVVFPGFSFGLTDNLGLSGGVSTIPGLGLDEQLFYVSSTAGFKRADKAAFAVGGLYAAGTSEDVGAALLFGIATLGSPDRSVSLGLAFAGTREDEELYGPDYEYRGNRRRWRFREAPILMVGGTVRVAEHVSLVTESWLFLGEEFRLSEQPFGLGLRFFNGRISTDVGFVFVGDVIDEGFPIPWLSFSYHFGPSRRAANRTAPEGLAGWRRAGGRR